jgi:DNA-binding transcriptional regulator YhcF (GntR family)
MFSPLPDGSVPFNPDALSKRFAKLAARLAIDTTLKNMRHYNATELIMADYNLKTVAGRLGHGGGGTTTLRVYTAWHAEVDQLAAGPITTRMPPRPTDAGHQEKPKPSAIPRPTDEDLQPYERIAADLRGAIDSGILMPGDPLPAEKTLAARYEVAASTAHRAVALLVAAGLVTASRGARARVAGAEPDPREETCATVVPLKP